MYPTPPIAENHILISPSVFNEGMRATQNKVYQKAVQRLTLILFALYLAVTAVLWYLNFPLVFLLGETIFLAALIFWLTIMLPASRRRSKYKVLAQGCINPQRTINFFSDRLTVISNTGKKTSISYTNISSWQETKHLYILNCSGNTHVLLDKKGFISGDFETIQHWIFNAA